MPRFFTRCFSTPNKEEVKNDGLCRERGKGHAAEEKRKTAAAADKTAV